MSYNPLVSIIIPVYNGADYMREAIDSAIAQTYENIEIIVVNDGSRDDGETERIALEYGDKIKYYHKENGGCASALNYGISKMNGEYFSWLSHDDVYFPDKIKKQVEYIEKNGFDDGETVISCGVAVINNAGAVIRSSTYSGERHMNAEEAFKQCVIGGSFNGCALLISKKILDKIGDFSREYTFILDWIYWTEIALAGFSYYCIPDVLVKNRRHAGQVSVKKRHLLKLETDRFIDSLCDRLSSQDASLANRKILYYFCAIRNRRDISNRLKQMLKDSGTLTAKDEIAVLKHRVKRAIMLPVKKIYHAIMIR